MKHLVLRKIILSSIALTMLPFSAACSPQFSEPMPNLTPKHILEGAIDTDIPEHSYLDFYTITSSTVEGVEGYAVALKDGANPGEITIPDKYPNTDSGTPVVGIMPFGFRESRAQKVTFKGDIQIIDYEAFFGSSIKNINIPWSIKKIGDSAFYNCGSLQTVTFNSTNKASTGNATSCPTCTTEGCEVDPGTDVTDALKCTLTNIPAFCFFNCRSLTTLTLPASIEEIEYEAFNGCSALASTLFFQNITTIRARAFQGCTALRTVYVPHSFFTDASGAGIEALAFNNCDPGLTFNFSTDSSTYNTWFANHSKWGWYNETANDPEYYTPTVTGKADVYFDTDWQYKIDEDGVTITSYTGAGLTKGFLVCPNELGGETVRRIDRMAFDSVKDSLTRLYLPTTLYAIENEMFGTNYKNLIVVDSRDHCNLDWDSANNTSVANPKKRIDLSHLVDLQFIGYWAFCKMTKRKEIELLHLPANLIAIGNEAFCRFEGNGHMDGVKEFLWDFDESTSRLQVIGTDAFYKLGVAGMDNQNYGNDQYNSNIKPATIVFPKSFKYFGMLKSDVDEYKVRQNGHIPFEFKLNPDSKMKWERPAHCFANCPLIGTVVFKGSMVSSETTDLIIPNQTFIYNENLQRIVFEERNGHFISFHTQAARYAQQCIGSNGVVGNDFRGRPFLQTIVLPTKYTKLRIQSLAFQGNPRAVMYLSGSYGNNGAVTDKGMYYDSKDNVNKAWTSMEFTDDTSLENATLWRTIGNEDYFTANNAKDSKYLGYCFSTSATTKVTTPDINKFYLNQKIPYYENVHYKATFSVKAYVVEGGVGKDKTSKIDVEVGEAGDTSVEYVEDDDCVYLCGGTDTIGESTVNKAIMAKYLYRLWPNGDDADKINNRNIETVTVKKSITVNNVVYTVTEIGDSAFSAAHCKEALKDKGREGEPDNQGATNDFKYLNLPNTVKRIGEYAFFRAYSLEKVSAYESEPNSAVDYNMPSNLSYIGKNAFSFCGIAQVLNIPDYCLFYENDDKIANHADYEVTSVFTNSFSLRRITFKHGGNGNKAESNYYVASTYKGGNNEYTTALYSKDTPDNPSRLLIVLNRNNGKHNYKHTDASTTINDLRFFDTPSKFDSPIQDFVKKDGSDTSPTFEVPSPYSGQPFLYGAYKMAYWIRNVKIGHCTTSTGDQPTNRNEILNQPLFSGICKRENNQSAAELYRIYLGKEAQKYPDIKCDLEVASGEMFNMPSYGFNGCEKLVKIELPNNTDGVLPDGLFKGAVNTSLKYSTTDGRTDAGYLDFTGTGYAGIGTETFVNNQSITHIITPAVDDFNIGQSAFNGCTNIQSVKVPSGTTNITFGKGCFNGCTALTELDLEGVSGKVTFNDGCFQGSHISSIKWPTSTATEIYINKNAFNNCDSLNSLTLPTKTKTLGDSCFQGCDNLASVTFAGTNTDIGAIGASAFQGCTSLNLFDFANLDNLNEIKSSAFASAGTVVSDGVITFDENIKKFGSSAFSGSHLKEVTFACSTIDLGDSAFANIATLEKVSFSNSGCSWISTAGSIFKNCTSLVDLQLPTGFSLSTQNSADLILGDTNVRLLTYHTFANQSPTSAWRKFDSATGKMKDPVYYVGELSDLSAASAGSEIMFWTFKNNNVIYLGTLTSKSESSAVFSEGYTMDASGNVTP